MRYVKRGLILLIFLAVSALFAFRIKDALRSEAEMSPQAGTRRPPAPLVESAKAYRGQITELISLVGTLKPKSQVQVLPKISGRINQLLVDTGHAVRRGSLIAKIEDDEIRQEIVQVQASLEVARAQLRQREAEVAQLERQLARARDLHEDNLIARQDLEQIDTQVRASRAQVDLAKAQINQVEAGISRLQIQLEYANIHAPMDGFVAQRLVDVGQLVGPNTPMVIIVGLRPMVARMSIVEKELSRFRVGLLAEINVDAYPGRSFGGRIARISPILDPATRTAIVEIELGNPTLELKPEMFARGTVTLGTERTTLLVPRESLVHRNNQSGVFMIQNERSANGKEALAGPAGAPAVQLPTVSFQPVELGASQGNAVEVVAGLQEGDIIVTRGANMLKSGDQIRLPGQDRPQGGGRQAPRRSSS